MNKEAAPLEAAGIGKERTARTPMYLGMVLFLISEFFLFGSLFWTYYYLRGGPSPWPPAGVTPDLNLAIINTVILLSSSAVIWWAGNQIRQGNERGLAAGLGLTMLLAVIFLGITIFEWTQLNFRPWTSAYGSIFYTLTGFHALHVFAGVMLMASMLTRTLRGRITARTLLPIDITSLYWHFVDFIWIIVFTTLFIVK